MKTYYQAICGDVPLYCYNTKHGCWELVYTIIRNELVTKAELVKIVKNRRFHLDEKSDTGGFIRTVACSPNHTYKSFGIRKILPEKMLYTNV